MTFQCSFKSEINILSLLTHCPLVVPNDMTFFLQWDTNREISLIKLASFFNTGKVEWSELSSCYKNKKTQLKLDLNKIIMNKNKCVHCILCFCLILKICFCAHNKESHLVSEQHVCWMIHFLHVKCTIS